jgi:sporadic carbohydrate cluster protein (TIGR04323 family)
MKSKIFTYTMPRPFYGLNIPIPIQSRFIRSYLLDAGYSFKLPVTEILFQDSYYMLFMGIQALDDQNSIVCMTSILMLPLYNSPLLDRIVSFNEKLKWHFPLEGLVLGGSEILAWAESFNYVNSSSH